MLEQLVFVLQLQVVLLLQLQFVLQSQQHLLEQLVFVLQLQVVLALQLQFVLQLHLQVSLVQLVQEVNVPYVSPLQSSSQTTPQ